MTPQPEQPLLLGSRQARRLESKGIRAGRRVAPADDDLVPVPPIHAVNTAGDSACGDTGLLTFPGAQPWHLASFVTRAMRCPTCLAEVGGVGDASG